MIGYFDTSAVIPLAVAEPSSARCAALWRACDVRTSSVPVIPEAHAVLAMALRLGRISRDEHAAATTVLRRRLDALDLISPTRELAERAAELALTYGLRGYDAMHVACAEAIAAHDSVIVSGDTDLLAALRQLGLATADTNRTDA